MISLKRILLPTDFSENSAVAVNYACALTEQFDSELHLLHVIETWVASVPESAMDLATFPMNFLEKREEAALAELGDVLDAEWRKDRHTVRATRQGSPFVQIVRYARDNQVDLIVMGTHGHTGVPHMLIGSVAERVVRKAPCPVLTVRPSGHQFVMP